MMKYLLAWIMAVVLVMTSTVGMAEDVSYEESPEASSPSISEAVDDGASSGQGSDSGSDAATAPAAERSKDDDDAPAAERSEDGDTAPAAETTEDGDTAPAAETTEDDDTAPAAETTEDGDTAPAAERSEDDDTVPVGETTDDDDAETSGEAETDGTPYSTAYYTGAEKTSGSRKVRLAILSDIHYVITEGASEAGLKNIDAQAQTEVRLMREIDGILDAALDEVSRTNPDVMLVCGDMLSNGEYAGAEALAAKLKSSKEKEGLGNTGIYVVNGNHDVNNSYAADYTQNREDVALAKRVQPSEFSTVFAGLGYGEDDHWEGGSHSVYVPTDD